ncbi:MAG: hypothetical protein HY301_03355 [Verrucomicrobia bacterium]|nr:hypothetical protein [Verrucomicrobiota bacterium]
MALIDLSPDALARLEAQLQADLDAVRRVRALLARPRNAASAMPAAPSPLPPPAEPEMKAGVAPAMENAASPAAPVPPPPPAPAPRADVNALIREIIGGLTEPFGIGAVKSILYKQLHSLPADAFIRGIMKKMVQEGAVRLVRADVGRGGSVYERVPPPEPPGGATDVPASGATAP